MIAYVYTKYIFVMPIPKCRAY